MCTPAEPEGLAAPHVRDRVRPLVWRPVVRALWLGAGVVGLGEERLGGVADHVAAAGGGHLRGHSHRQQRVHEAAVGTQKLVGDAALHPLVRDVQDRHGRRLGPGAGRRGHRQQRLQGGRRLLAVAYGGVYVVHDLTAVRRDEVGDFRRVYAGPTPHGHEPVEVAVPGEVRRRLQRVGRRLDAGAVPHLNLHALRLDELLYAARYAGPDDPRVGDEHDPVHAEPPDLPADLLGRAPPVLYGRRLHGKDGLVAVGTHALPFPAPIPCTRQYTSGRNQRQPAPGARYVPSTHTFTLIV